MGIPQAPQALCWLPTSPRPCGPKQPCRPDEYETPALSNSRQERATPSTNIINPDNQAAVQGCRTKGNRGQALASSQILAKANDIDQSWTGQLQGSHSQKSEMQDPFQGLLGQGQEKQNSPIISGIEDPTMPSSYLAGIVESA